MSDLFVKPAEGCLVRHPQRSFRPIPPEGDFVPDIAYWQRLIAAGDVTVAEQPGEAPPKEPPPMASPSTDFHRS